MDYYTEASLDVNSTSKLKKKGIKTTTDTLSEINGNNAIVDVSKFNDLSDKSYIDKLYKICEKLKSYNRKIIYIPVSKWYKKSNGDLINSNTPIGVICRYIKQNPIEFKKRFEGFVFVFHNSGKQQFALYVDQYKSSEYFAFEKLLQTISTPAKTGFVSANSDDVKSPVKDVVDASKEDKKALEAKKQDLVNAIAAAAETSESEEEAWEKLQDDEYFKSLIAELEDEDDGRPKFNNARNARLAELNDKLLDKRINNRRIGDIINPRTDEDMSKFTHLKVDSVNDEWNNVNFAAFNKKYDINSDIIKCLNSLSDNTYPVSIVDINVEDTSTNMDLVDTYTVEMEDGYGKRFTLVFDIPKFKNNRFMRLRGNEKVMSGQLLLLPCLKTDEDTVQCVSNYNKIFIRRHGLSGRSFPSSDKLLKALRKYEGRDIKVYPGDNNSICSKYELPVDYIDLASNINRIETSEFIYYFNQDVYYDSKFGINADRKSGIPYRINKVDGSVEYFKDEGDLLSYKIANELCTYSQNFQIIYRSIKAAERLNYSEASILSNRIPLAVVIGYSVGMTAMLKMVLKTDTLSMNVVYGKNPKYDKDTEAVIKFSDGYIKYRVNYSNSMLLNGLSVCPTEAYSLDDINKRSMWLDFLDEFGGRILSDGLDNFVDLFIDPITEEVCEHCGIPSDYFGMLMYANNLLADNKYNRHTDITGNRYRTTEVVAGYFYKVLAKSYTDYKLQIKRGRKVGMSMKRSAVIDAIMADPMSSDLSILNPLLEIEASNSVSFKGLSGMNSDRSYGLDKRTYDDSMINKLALSTGFAANVGINRQTTIDMDVEGTRGYIKSTDKNDMGVTKTFSMTEAVTPFGTTHDDPFRSAMTFIQTSKHSMRTKKSAPLLITNGADEAMPYLSSDTYAFKAKADGKVIEIVDGDYMIIEYNNPINNSMDGTGFSKEIISLKDEVKKNSDGGFFITLSLSTDLKVGSTFKEGDIIAYDHSSYSNKLGEGDNLAYNVGVLAKVAILNTDEGFEDSTSVSNWLSEAMATDVVVEKETEHGISKNTNVYYMVKVGQEVQEGDPLLVFQNSFDEKDANALLRNITDSEFVSDLGRIRLKSKYTGVIQDIRIYRTCEIDELSDSLKKIVVDYEKDIKDRKALYDKHGMPGGRLLPPDYKMEPTGIMKNITDGVKIVFYIKYNDKLSVGDKCVAQSANKGVVKNIFPEGLEPYTARNPDEKIHALFAARSFNARMVTSVWTSGAINKCMIELDKQVKEIMGLEAKTVEEIQ